MKRSTVLAWSMTVSLLLSGALAGFAASQTPEQKNYELNLHFDSGKAEIKPADQAMINQVGEEMKNYPYALATIEGYADPTGSEAANQDLSLQRAKAVKDYLQAKYAIEGNRLKTVGFGETKPVTTNTSRAGLQRNRTVLVTVNRFMTSQQDQRNHLP